MDRESAPLLRESNVHPAGNITYDAVDTIQAEDSDSFGNIPTFRKLPQYIAAITATFSALSAGAVLGWTSPILDEIKHGHFHNITVDNSQMGWIGSFVTLGGMAMCIPTGFLCDLMGRKKTLLLLVLPFTIGWALILYGQSIAMLYLGRFITGVASGASCVAAPLYISEIAHKDIRGALGSYFQLMVTIGIFLAYLSGKFLAPIPYTYFCASLPVIFFILFAFQPETPTYCLKRGLYHSALTSLRRLRGDTWNNDLELIEIDNALKDSLEATLSVSQTLRRKANWKALLIAYALMFFQQFSGINAVILYTSDIFESSGVKLDAKTAAIVVGGVQVTATFASSLVIDRSGRKILLFVSALTTALCSVVLSLFFSLSTRSSINPVVLRSFGFVPVVALCAFVALFSLGLGPIPWVIPGEIFAAEMRSFGGSSAGTVNWLLAFVVTKWYLEVVDLVGQDSVFAVFAFLSSLGAVFVYFLVPETKGKSIEQVQAELEN